MQDLLQSIVRREPGTFRFGRIHYHIFSQDIQSLLKLHTPDFGIFNRSLDFIATRSLRNTQVWEAFIVFEILGRIMSSITGVRFAVSAY